MTLLLIYYRGGDRRQAEYDLLYLETSLFVHFMVQILSHRSNSVYTAMSFKILNDVVVFTLLDL